MDVRQEVHKFILLQQPDGPALMLTILEPDLEAHRLWYGQTAPRQAVWRGQSLLLVRPNIPRLMAAAQLPPEGRVLPGIRRS